MNMDEQIKNIIQSQINKSLDSLVNFISRFIKENIDEKKSDKEFVIFFEELKSKNDSLLELIPIEIQPTLLFNIRDLSLEFHEFSGEKFVFYENGRIEVTFKILKALNSIENLKINLDNSENQEIKNIFQKLFEKGNRREIFNEIFDELKGLVESSLKEGDIQKNEVAEMLKNIYGLLQINENDSYIDLVFNWKFAINLLKNYIKSQFEATTGIGAIIDTLIEHFNKAEERISVVQNEIANDANSYIKSNAILRHNHHMLTYQRNGLLGIA